jgi:ribosomal protein L10
LKKIEEEKNADPATPGRRMKRQRVVLPPELKVAGALIDGTVFLPEQVRDMSKLPTLDTLRAQIVGLLSAPSSQLAGILSQASGGQLARTLEGFKKGLEESSSS